MNEKEIIELIAGLNPAALEAFREYITYMYVALFSALLGGLSIIAILAFAFYKVIMKTREW